MRRDGGFRCKCPQCAALYDVCPAARELEEIITDLTRERDDARTEADLMKQVGRELQRERDEARAERDRLRALLREVEWRENRDGDDACPLCYRRRIDGHTADCRLAAALEGR